MEINHLIRKVAVCIAVALPLTWLASCSDEEEGRIEVNSAAPAKVSNVASTSGPGEVYLTWNIPASSSFMYSKVTYTNSKGQEAYKIFSKELADENGVMRATISGFVSTDPVEFNIYACSVRGNSESPVTYSAAPGAPAFLAVAQSLTAEPAWGAVKIGYENKTTATVYVNVDYALKSDPSKTGNFQFEALPGTTSSRLMALCIPGDNFINGEEAILTLKAQDIEGNAADPINATVRTKKVAPIDRSAWTFPGYQDAYGATTGYDSQEAGGEGPSPKGRVIAMIDGSNGTFWHTKWKNGADKYPHFFIVDMGEDKEVVAVGIRRRPGKDGVKTHIGQTISTCESSAANGTNADAWLWTNQGWSAFDVNSEDNQVIALQNPKSSRYIKAYFAETDKGTSDFTIIGEFNAYTPAE